MSNIPRASKNTARVHLCLPVEDYNLLQELAFKRGFRSVPGLIRNWTLYRLEQEKQRGKFVSDDSER